jgi:hypothetical protein
MKGNVFFIIRTYFLLILDKQNSKSEFIKFCKIPPPPLPPFESNHKRKSKVGGN